MKPNGLTTLFAHATVACPQDIANYGRCVLAAQEKDSLRKGVCDKEFRALRACFDKCRKKAGRR